MNNVEERIDWTKVNHDINGNPRYVCHFLELVTDAEQEEHWRQASGNPNITGVSLGYDLALKRAHKIGGKKFHNKQFGGGIVFQSYCLRETEEAIRKVMS